MKALQSKGRYAASTADGCYLSNPSTVSTSFQGPASVSFTGWPYQVAANTGIGIGRLIGEPRPDGINDGINIIQGRRVSDTTFQEWTSPDMNPGMVSDPMSEVPYMWNRNNPVEYSDPTGYVAVVSTNAQNQVTIWFYASFDSNVDAQTKQKILDDISSTWTGQFGKYNVTTHAVEADAKTPSAWVNKVVVGPRGSHYGGVLLTRTLYCDAYGVPTAYAHEAGHLFGLIDEYKGPATRHPEAVPGYPWASPRGIMVTLGGVPQEYDITAIISTTWNVHI